ncbi:fumarate reductase flavoprotein subunit [Sphingomonas zeicaulis]|uniref:FAD-dependent oxidoreductase n=1 Tax=Sphingomonas zeicaulis TaxID=1632740 RepID=UPI003D23BC07
MTDFELTVPLIVVGGGACGTVAALAAHAEGVSPLLIEQDAHPHGSTAMSQGLIAAAGTRAQAAHGVEDDGETFFRDIMEKTRGRTDPVIARTLAFESGPTLDWLVETIGLPWELDTRFRASYGNSCLRVHGWPGHGGSDMVDLLHARLGMAGIDVVTEARLTDIIADVDGRVLGIELTRADGAIERIGCEALILATGGFAANEAMVAEYLPEAAAARLNAHEGSRGDGIRLGQAIGAAVGDMGSYQGYAMLTDPHGISVPPGVILEGGVLVNVRGQRFVDECADIAGMVHPVLAQPGDHCWVVYDARIEAATAHIPEARALNDLKAPKTADTLDDLAARIGVDRDALDATLNEARAAQAEGRPDAFGRHWGDDQPPSASYRALRVVGALYHTQGGLQIDGEARVLRGDGSSLPNLFAGGGAARSVSGPSSWGYIPAMGLCTAVTLGRVAGRAAARLVDASSSSHATDR